MNEKDPRLFIDPHIHYPDLNSFTFADYIVHCRNLITEYRLDLANDGTKIINANAPFELQPANTSTKIRYGALLTHGFLESCFHMQDIGKHLQAEGFLVRSILLPGHGTRPGALLSIQYQQWIDSIRYGIKTLREDVDKIILVGNSTGSLLSLYSILEDDTKIAGAILISPALEILSRFAFISHLPIYLSHLWPRAAWFHKVPAFDYTKYRSPTYNGIYQVYLLGEIFKKFKKPACPLFFVVTTNDDIINPQTALTYFKDHHHAKSRMILYSPVPLTQNDSRITVRNSHYPEWNIENFSHITLPIAPNNPHYGMHGDFRLASHIDQKNNTVYGEFNAIKLEFNDFLVKYRLCQTRYRRLTFNPDFSFLTSAISEFIASLD